MALGDIKIGPQKRGYQRTTDATVTTIATVEIPDSTSVMARISVIGQNITDHIHHSSVNALYRNGVSATFISQFSNNSVSAGAGTWAITIDCTGTTLRVRVTGQASHTIDWLCKVSFDICAVSF